MRVIPNKDGDLLSQFDNFKENDTPVLKRLADLPPQIKSTPHEKMLIIDHSDANKGKLKGYLYPEDILGFSKNFEKVTKSLSFHLMLKTANLQDIIIISLADDINVTINNLYLFIPNLITSVVTEVKFNEATQKKYRISYDEYFKERRVISDLLFQHDIGSAQRVKVINFLIRAHQTKDRIDTPNKNNKIVITDNLESRKYYFEIDEKRYPGDSVSKNYTEKDYIDQYRDLKLLFEEYIG